MKEQQKRTQVGRGAAAFLRHSRGLAEVWPRRSQARTFLASSGVLSVLTACGSDDAEEAPAPSAAGRTNTPPTLHPNANLEGAWTENAPFAIDLDTIFRDADNDVLTYRLMGDGPPAGITLDRNTLSGIIRDDALLGTHTLVVEARDAETSHEVSLTLTFHNTNDAPFALGHIRALSYNEDEPIILDIVRGNNRLFGDDDADDRLTVAATGLPEGLNLTEDGVLSGRVVLDQEARTHSVTFTATDASGKAAQLVIPLTIRNVNDAPVVVHTIGSLQIEENDPVSIALDTGAEPLFEDHDGDVLTYQVDGLPVGLYYDADLRAIVGVVTDDRALERSYRVTVQATDPHQATAEQIFDLTIMGVNDVPVIGEAIPSKLLRGNAETFELDLQDPENPFFLDGDPDEELSYEVSGLALIGFTFSDGVISGRTAHASQNGTHFVTVTATDSEGAQAVQTFTLDIQGVSSPPQLIASLSKEFTDAENDPISHQFSDLFFDPEGDTIHYRVLNAPPLAAAARPPGTTRLTYDSETGMLVGHWLEADGTVSSAPTGLQFDGAMGLLTGRVEDDRFVAPHTLTLEASDGQADPITGLITLTITNVNDAPEGYLTLSTLTFDEEVTFSLDLFSHFSDDDMPFHGDMLAFTGTGLLPEMTLTAGELRAYVPDRAYEGITGMATLTATDLDGATAELVFDYVVTDLNDNPELLPTAMLTVTVTENDAVTLTLADIFFDNDGDVLDYAVPALETGGALTRLGLTLDAANGLITGSITDDNFVEINNLLELRAADWRATIATTLTLFVENVNDPPEVNPAFDRTYGFRENHAFIINLDGFFTDVDRGDTLVYDTVSDLTALGLAFDPATRELTGLITDDSLVGVHTLEFEATDTSGARVSESITLTITNVDDAPRLITAPTLSYRFQENDAFTITLEDIFEDPEGDPFVSVASTGSVPLFGTGGGPDPIAWAGLVTDDALVEVHTITLTATSRPHPLRPALSSEATITLEIVNVNDPPRVLDPTMFSRAWTVQENDVIALDWSGAFTDDDDVHGDTLTYRLTGDVLASPEIAPSAGNTGLTGRIRDDAYVGVHELTYEATDTSGVTTTVTVALTVANVDDLPELVPGAVVSYSFAENDSFEIELGDLFSDDDNDRIQSITFTSLHTPPPVFINLTTGLGRLEPGGAAVRGQVFDDDKVGTHTIELTAETVPGPTVSTILTITITPVNDPPMVNPALTNQVFEENASFELALDELFSDPDTLIYGTKSIDIPLGSLDADPGGDYRFIVLDPGTAMERDALQIQVTDDAKLGRHTLSVTVEDVDGSMAVATLTVDITNVNDVPVLTTAPREFSVTENADFTQDLTGLFTDDDIGDSFTYRLIAPPTGIGVGLDPAMPGFLAGTIEDEAFGGDNFLTVEIEDAAGATARATITLDVTLVNDAPEPVPGTVFERTVNENAAINLDLSVLFQDEEGDPLTFDIDDSMGPMLAAYGLALDPATGLLTGMVTDDTYVRDLELPVEVSDGMLSVSQMLTLTVVNVNDVPRLTGGMTIVAFDENDSVSFDFSTLFVDDDIPFHGDTLTYAFLGMVIETMSLDRDTGTVMFSVTDDQFVGSNTLTLRAEDASGAGAQATLTVNVANVNDVPEANITFDFNNTVTIGDASVWTWDLEDLILDDDRTDTLNLQITGGTLPTGLALVSTPMHQIQGMVADLGLAGMMYALTIEGTDGAGAMASSTITLSVEPPNRPPEVRTPIMDRSILQTGSLLIPLLPHFRDPDGDPLTLSLESPPPWLSINGANELEAMGGAGIARLPDGVYTVTVRASDGEDDVETSFTLTVEVDNPPGIIMPFRDQNLRAFGITLAPNSFFSTETGDSLTYAVTKSGDSLTSFGLDTTTDPANPVLEIDPVLARIHDFGTVETYTVTAEDSVGQTTLERFTVSTNSINLPVLTPPAGSTQRQLGFHIRGNHDGQNWGQFVRGLGDFDGDGDEDFLVGLASSLGGMRTGAVVYGMDFSSSADPDFGTIERGDPAMGDPPRRVLDLATYMSSDGALLTADRPFSSANSAGDIDGDGLPDLIFGNQEFTSSDVQVVLTGAFGSTFAPNAVGTDAGQGFRIERNSDPGLAAAQFGTYVGPVGDINSDGIGDFAVFASWDTVGGLAEAGRAYILYGMASFTTLATHVTLGASLTPDQGFVLSGTQANHRFGYVDGHSGHQTPIAGAGDFNGDGLQDLVVGYPRFENGGMEVGAAYLIYGRQDVVRRDLQLGSISSLDGFRIVGEPGFAGPTYLGWSVAGLGDINGDGYDDIGIGERGGIATTNLGSRSFIIFGRPTADVTNYDVAGITAVDNILRLTSSGGRIASAGDINGDGLADVLLGRPQEDASYLLFGMSTWDTAMLLNLSPDLDASIGIRIQGGGMDQSGFSVAAAGDIDKDGFDDLIIGAPTHNDDGVVTRTTATGGAYVVYGHPDFGSVDETDGGTLALSDARTFGSAGGTALAGTQTRTAIYAGAGNDTIFVETLGADYRIDGGTGNDRLVLRGPGPHFIDLVDPENRYRLKSIESIEVDNDPLVASSAFIRLDYQAILDLSEQRNNFPAPPGLAADHPRGKFLFILDVPSLNVPAMPANPIHDVTLLLEEGIGVSNGWNDPSGIELQDPAGRPITYLDVYELDNALIAFPEHINFASAMIREDPSTRGLSPLSGFLIPGEEGEDEFGASVAGLGDVNGDGIDDFVVGAPGADSGGGHSDAGRAYVLFGRIGPRLHLDVGMLAASEGFIIQGDRDDDNLGASVRSAGDFNGDGLQDILVGAPEGDDGPTNSGEGYLIYGRVPVDVAGTPPLLDLSSLAPDRGFVIQGANDGDKLGTSATGIGDINGDGYDDLALGAPDNDESGSNAGIAYILLGREASPGMYPGMPFHIRDSDGETDAAGPGTTPRQVSDLSGFPAGSPTGFTIKGGNPNDKTGTRVAGLGDVNGDGLNDFAVGAPGSMLHGGQIVVIYGETGTSTALDLTSGIGMARGFAFIGPEDFGYAVSSAGDINGDGLDDILVGSPKEGGLRDGSAYVLFGQEGTTRGTLDARNPLGANGFAINGGVNNDEVAIDVASAGDVNGDGLADIIVGSHLRDAPAAYFGGLSNAGAAFIMYGMQTGFGVDVDIDTLVGTGTTGFTVYGGAHEEKLGKSVAGAGDINGDGYDDLLIASPEHGNYAWGRTDQGRVAVIYGMHARDGSDEPTGGRFTATAGEDTLRGTAGSDELIGHVDTEALYGGAGQDRLEIQDATLRRVDGGHGLDTLVLAGAGVSLRLDGAGTRAAFRNLETVSLTDAADELTLNAQAVFDIAGAGSNQEGLADAGETYLRIMGTSGMLVLTEGIGGTGGWVRTDDVLGTADQYQLDRAILLVDDGVNVA